MGPKISFLFETIKNSNMTIEERIGVAQDLKLMDEYFDVSELTILDGYNKMIKNIHSRDIEESHELEIANMLNETYDEKIINNSIISKVIDPIFEAEDKKDDKKEDKKKDKGQEDKEPLARALRSKGESQSDLAGDVGVHKSTVSRWKTGTRKPSFDALVDIKKKLGSVTSIFPELG
jgi:DNA-binding transcriptional regulator YiaG